MSMSAVMSHTYQAFVNAGIAPERAGEIERALRTDVAHEVTQSQTTMEKSILDRVMTKEDGLQMELRLKQKLDEKLDALSSKMFAAIGVGTAFIAAIIALMAVIVTLHK